MGSAAPLGDFQPPWVTAGPPGAKSSQLIISFGAWGLATPSASLLASVGFVLLLVTAGRGLYPVCPQS